MERPEICHIIAALDRDPQALAECMRPSCDAVIVEQCDTDGREEFERNGHRIRVVRDSGRGVGRSRNQGLLYSDGEITLIGDEDIVYDDGYAELVTKTFAAHPEADVLLFNVEQSPGRETYRNTDVRRVRFYNCGRYPAYSIAIRTDRQREANVWFSHLFGGGAPYMAGEDSLFLTDCLRKHLVILRVPVCIGRETPRESTWFKGHTAQFFYDRGKLYKALYGKAAGLFAFIYLLRNRRVWLTELSFSEAWKLLTEGMR